MGWKETLGNLLDKTVETGESATDIGQWGASAGASFLDEETVDKARTAELLGDLAATGKDAIKDYLNDKPIGEVLEDAAPRLAGVAADYAATAAANSFGDWLDEKLGGWIPDSIKETITTAIGEIAQEAVEWAAAKAIDLVKEDKINPDIADKPVGEIREELAEHKGKDAAMQAALAEADLPAELKGQVAVNDADLEAGTQVRANAGVDFERATEEGRGLAG